MTARLDAAAGVAGREVTWNAAEFQGFRHGYAGTIYKGQGQDARPHVSAPHPPLAGGGELRSADPPTPNRTANAGRSRFYA